MQLVKRAMMSLLGVAVMLAYWSFTGSSNSSEVQGIPAKVGKGGGGLLAISVDSTTPARFSISFDENDKTRHFWTPVTPGSKTWVVDVPRESGGYIELSAESPKVGDKLSWSITLNGETVDKQDDTLEAPLAAGYGFFLQSFYDDYSSIRPEGDRAEAEEED